jgi:hypothetical protein
MLIAVAQRNAFASLSAQRGTACPRRLFWDKSGDESRRSDASSRPISRVLCFPSSQRAQVLSRTPMECPSWAAQNAGVMPDISIYVAQLWRVL